MFHYDAIGVISNTVASVAGPIQQSSQLLLSCVGWRQEEVEGNARKGFVFDR